MSAMDEIPRPGGFRRWPLFLIAAPAAVAVWSGWVGLGALAGFGVVHPLPGIAPGFQLNTAITLPVGVEAYGAYALGAWLAPFAIPGRARTFARRSAIGALLLGMTGQISYHLLAAAHAVRAPWLVVVAVSCMPVVTLGFGVALTHLLRAGEPETAREMAPAQATQDATAQAISEPPRHATEEAAADATQMPRSETEATPASEPPAMPRARQPKEPQGLSREPEAIKARAAYRRSVQSGKPLSERALGAMFGRGRTWGGNRIRECEEGLKLAGQAEAK